MPKILLITHSKDFFTIDNVESALQKLGAETVRFNTDLYPTDIQINNHFNGKSSGCSIQIGTNKHNIEDISGVWMRRVWLPKMPDDIPENYKTACINESRKNLDNCLKLMKNAVWMDPLEKINAAENKLLQLQIASKKGIKIPNTIITNSPSEAKSFFIQNNKKVITKMQSVMSYSMEGNNGFKTSRISEEDMEDMEGLKLCPMIFQEEIEKEHEYRVIYVDRDFYVGGLKTEDGNEYKVDIKETAKNDCRWFTAEIPESEKKKLIALMNELGLTFGAIDIVKGKDGSYTFLEVNPVGEWGMIEKELDLPISEAIARSIMKRITQKN